MRRIASLLIVCSMLVSACGISEKPMQQEFVERSNVVIDVESQLGDVKAPEVLHRLKEEIYSSVIDNLGGQYYVQNVEAVYVSKEYLDELAYNSQSNIYFGYTLNELLDQFKGTKYVFAIDESGQTVVKEFEVYDNTFEKAIKNVTIGTGVILVCVTVSTTTGGAVSTIFLAAAKTGSIVGSSSGVISGLATGVLTGIQTGDFDKSLKSAVSVGSESFKWGAIVGTVSGGALKYSDLLGTKPLGLDLSEAIQIQRVSKWPAYIVSKLKNMKQFEFFKQLKLKPKWINRTYALVRKIDLGFISKLSNGQQISNLERMKLGLAPIEPATGESYQLHHIGQEPDSFLAILTKEEHQKNYDLLHDPTVIGVHSQVSSNEWASQRKEFWKSFSKLAEISD
ncbi:HNH/ENDO VII family nuclease [Aerococcaceae bacterium NML180378]|nr:HNH/ENDO VII family nuclease [Aerococcaceae bacterium NML180378]